MVDSRDRDCQMSLRNSSRQLDTIQMLWVCLATRFDPLPQSVPWGPLGPLGTLQVQVQVQQSSSIHSNSVLMSFRADQFGKHAYRTKNKKTVLDVGPTICSGIFGMCPKIKTSLKSLKSLKSPIGQNYELLSGHTVFTVFTVRPFNWRFHAEITYF